MYGGLIVIDVSNAGSPVEVGRVDLPASRITWLRLAQRLSLRTLLTVFESSTSVFLHRRLRSGTSTLLARLMESHCRLDTRTSLIIRQGFA